MFIQTSPFGPPTAVGGSASAKKVAVGGKLGIVKDPFAKLGTPQYLGATLPLDGYGIINLSLSEDGQVLIGQLKGGFSANIFDMAQKPHQNLAWNVSTLLDAALALPEKDRQSKHIVLAASAAQLIPVPTTADGYVTAPAGTAFDPDVLVGSVEGRMGDVIEVDLRKAVAEAIARELVGLPNAEELPVSRMKAEQKFALEEALPYAEREENTTSFSLAIQPAPSGLRAEETWVLVGVALRSTPPMTGKPLVPVWARTLAWSGRVFDIGEVRGYRCGSDDHPV